MSNDGTYRWSAQNNSGGNFVDNVKKLGKRGLLVALDVVLNNKDHNAVLRCKFRLKFYCNLCLRGIFIQYR